MKKQWFFILSLSVGIGLAINASADSHEDGEASPPNLADVWVMVPKPGHGAEFEAALKDHIAARKEAGDPRSWSVYTVEVGENMGTYGIRHCCFDWPDQDAYIEWASSAGVSGHFSENVRPHVAKMHHTMDVIDWEMSQWPADSGGWNFVGVTEWAPKMGHELERQEALSKMIATAKEHGWEGRWMFMNSVGGPTNFRVAVPFENYADMAPPEVTFFEFMGEHMGTEEARAVYRQFAGSFEGAEYNVYRLRHDLSTPPDEE